MQRTLSEHIIHLEGKIKTLKDELQAQDLSPSGRCEIRALLDISEQSLEHFKKAYELEQRISH